MSAITPSDPISKIISSDSDELPEGLNITPKEDAEELLIKVYEVNRLTDCRFIIVGASIGQKKRAYVEMTIIPVCGKLICKAVPINILDHKTGKIITHGKSEAKKIMRTIVESTLSQLSAQDEKMAVDMMTIAVTSMGLTAQP